jgi:(R,R)-butanediol dehydrogenase/meso-butanediol dehydrogenase/diacetyl reductase
MRALVYHGNRDLRLENVPEPEPGPDEVKIRIDYCGICATDIEEYLYGPKFIAHDAPNPVTGKKLPVITGHEITGTVVRKVRDISEVAVGDRVVLNGIISCKRCWWCSHGQPNQCPSLAAVGFATDGGLADYMVWPASQVVKLPDNVTSEEAALVEPCSVAIHAVRRGQVQKSTTVAVIGAGTVGMLAMQAAKAMGAKVFAIDKRQVSLDMAKRLGADSVVKATGGQAAEQLKALTNGVGPDVVIDAAGAKETPGLAADWARPGGCVVIVAIYATKSEVDFNTVVAKETDLVGSLGYHRSDVEEAVRLIAKGAVKTTPLISDKIGLDEVIDKGFTRMLAPSKDVFRILVSPAERPRPV